MERILAKDIMVSKVITLNPSTWVFDAIETLLRHNISGAPILDEDGHFLGIFSEKSSMQALLTGTYHELPGGQVSAYAVTDPQTITEHTDIYEIARIFSTTPIRRLPVLRDGKLVGQVSRRDVLRASSDHAAGLSMRPPAHPRPLYLSAVNESPDAYPIN
ncbi:MAG: CBS domain-containing protein [Myxococcota bacterium]|nr:CBS domain-containing protein [Myxococcota bacterium]